MRARKCRFGGKMTFKNIRSACPGPLLFHDTRNGRHWMCGPAHALFDCNEDNCSVVAWFKAQAMTRTTKGEQ